jgi:hypothetical protein
VDLGQRPEKGSELATCDPVSVWAELRNVRPKAERHYVGQE